MTDTLPQLALRELRTEFGKPATVPAMVGIAVVLTIAGAFETHEMLRPLPRFAYWLVLVTSTYAIGTVVTGAILHRWPGLAGWRSLAVTALATGVSVVVAVLAINFAAFGFLTAGRHLLLGIGNIMAIAFVITYLLSLPQTAKPPIAPAILDRVPLDKRGSLLALTVEDHYTRVRTSKGDHLVLMRLRDAIREVGDTAGAQVHRSHWVAFDAVTACRRDGDRAILTLSDGSELPVSRANVAKVRDAGLLAK